LRFNQILISYMKKSEENLSASALRRQLIKAIEDFINGLEHGSLAALLEKKARIAETLELLHVKESKEAAPLSWGKNSTGSAKVIPLSDEKDDFNEDNDAETEISGMA
jgi:hypothetical protein